MYRVHDREGEEKKIR